MRTTLSILCVCFSLSAFSQVFWIEDFDDGGGGRWTLENALGSLTNPTPAGIVGLTYGTNAPVAHDNFIIGNQNTPQLDADIVIGQSLQNQGQFVRGRHYDCAAPSDLPNPFINGAQPGPNQSLHITAYGSCATLLYAGTPQSNDWNCISDPDNGDVQTQTEQIAFLNQNIDATGRCNLVLTADFYLGGDSDGLKSHGTILYSVDAGVTWEILEDNLRSCSPFLAGTCNNWFRRSFAFPANANNQNDLRIAMRWYDDGDIDNTGDYALGASFNVDNIMISSCEVPAAEFSISQTQACKGDVVFLNDLSTTTDGFYTNCTSVLSGICGITDWQWDIDNGGSPTGFTFVGGTSATSQNAQITFTANGTYNVTLTATNCAGDGIEVKTGVIVVADCPPIANFTGSQTTVCTAPVGSLDTVTFTDLSTTPTTPITTWTWSFTPATVTFVNGTNASMQNIDVTFDTPGTYQVELTVTSSEGSDTETRTAYVEAIDCNCGGSGGGGAILVYEEDFDGNGGAGSNWDILNEDIGTQGDIPNQWYISDQEDGNAAGACGSSGSGDNSLHLSSCSCWVGDLGAAYEIGAGFCGLFPGVCPITDKRSYSVDINTTGVTGLTLAFNYIEGGQGTVDDALVEYSIDGGASWLTLDNPAKTALTCAPQGTWTAYSFGLPVTCENIPNLRIGFRWYNNDGGGTDPSFAVDDITIIGTGGGGGTAKTWEGDVSNDWNTAANWSDNAVPTSADDVLIPATVCGACVMPEIDVAAVANNVCNFGTITINTDNTLTIDSDLLNEGAITTTTVNPFADVIFANSASVYKGTGTLFDVDVSTTSSDLTLETNLSARSFTIATAGTVDLDAFELSVNRDLSKTNGTFNAVNGTINFVNACGGCLDQTNTTDVSLDANQTFGDMNVIKTAGIKASFVSAFDYTVNTPNTVTITSGILDANTFTLNGTGNLTMDGGELQLAKCATVLPELTGTYTLPAGKITFDGVCAQSIKSTPTIATNYYKVAFMGSGVKSLTGNTEIADSLIFDLPTTLGNYVDAGTDTLFVRNNTPGIVLHTGGHVLGEYNRAITASGGDYTYHVGSDNTDTETYFEPITLTPNGLSGTSSVTARFFDVTPNPAVVVPNVVYGFPPNQDTLDLVETEGYWRMNPFTNISSGSYQALVSPDATYWTFDRPWASNFHALLKQDTEGAQWDFATGGQRVNDSTTMNFTDFSNYVLAYTSDVISSLAVELLYFNAVCDGDQVYLNWASASEYQSHSYILERSTNGTDFEVIAELPSSVNSTTVQTYAFREANRNLGAYYRLKERDMEGIITTLQVLYVACFEDKAFDLWVYPNPTSGPINYAITSNTQDQVDVLLTDVSGKIIEQRPQTPIQKGTNLFSADIALTPGVYMVIVRSKKGTLTERFVVQ